MLESPPFLPLELLRALPRYTCERQPRLRGRVAQEAFHVEGSAAVTVDPLKPAAPWKAQIQTVVDLLVKARLRCQPVLVVAGAGISAPEIPAMEAIIVGAAERLESWAKVAGNSDPVLKEISKPTMVDGLRQLFYRGDPDPLLAHSTAWREAVVTPWLHPHATGKSPKPHHKWTMELLRRNLVRCILTPNWDTLLEDAGETFSKEGTPSGLPASACQNRLAPLLVLRDAPSLREWVRNPRAAPALVKLHGDIRVGLCESGHAVEVRVEAPFGGACSVCKSPVNIRPLLPDSARRQSRDLLAYLVPDIHAWQSLANSSEPRSPHGPSESRFSAPPWMRFGNIGVVLVIGFSGKYDRHLTALIEAYAREGASIVHLDSNPDRMFGGTEILIKGDAATLIPELAAAWIARTDTDESSPMSSRGRLPPLDFVRSEEQYDADFGRIPVTRLEVAILHHPEFIRLRGIKQLGQKQRFYPAAGHTRFEHCLASLRVADDLYEGLVDALETERRSRPYALGGYRPTPDERQLVRLATMFHDFGHVWFSHLGESVLRELSEPDGNGERGAIPGLEDLVGSAPDIHEQLSRGLLRHGRAMPSSRPSPASASVAPLLEIVTSGIGESCSVAGVGLDDFLRLLSGQSRLKHINSLVASSIDADKIEYLNRDASRTGKGGGDSVRAEVVAQALTITELGLTAVRLESLSVAERVAAERYLMFQSVYHDDRVRALEASLKTILVEWLRVRWASFSAAEVCQDLVLNEAQLLQAIGVECDDPAALMAVGGRPPRDNHTLEARNRHWVRVLGLLRGEGEFPQLAVWILRPSDRVRTLPIEEAAEQLHKSLKALGREMSALFLRNYAHRGVFALDAFQPHSDRWDVPVAGERALFLPRDVSPLIAGLKDPRRTSIRLAVLYFEESDARRCREEVDLLLSRVSDTIEVAVQLSPDRGEIDVA